MMVRTLRSCEQKVFIGQGVSDRTKLAQIMHFRGILDGIYRTRFANRTIKENTR